ncbi:MAG: sigma-70 family RNA polymerase sigma factor [Planctomycetota bacterium]
MSSTHLDPDRLLAQSAWLRRLAARLVDDHGAADDLVQDTLVTALERPPADAATDGRLRGWLASVLRTRAGMRRRADVRRTAREHHVARADRIDPAPATGTADDAIAAQRRLLDALATLPARDREVVVLRFFDDLPPRRIAQRLGTTSDAVRTRLSRALATLRLRLVPAHGDRRALALALLPLLPRGAPPAAGLLPITLLLMNAKSKALLALLGLGLGTTLTLLTFGQADTPPADAASGDRLAQAVATGDPGAATDSAADDDQDAPAAARERIEVARPAPPARPARPQFQLTVVVRCVTADGAPIAGARLIAHEVEGQPAVATDADGRARIDLRWPAKLTAGNEHWIMTTVTGDGLMRLVQQTAVQGDADLVVTLGDVVLEPGGDVAGTVLGVDGRPAANAMVWASGGIEPATGIAELQRRVLSHGFPRLAGGISAWTRTDDHGRYRLDGLPATSVSIVARTPGAMAAYTRPFDVVPGRMTAAPTLTFEALPLANRIAGRVLDGKGRPLPGARIEVFENRGPRNVNSISSSGTGRDGAFAIPVLPDRSYTLVVDTQHGRRREKVVHDVAAGTPDLVVQFAPARTVALDVRGPDGAAVTPQYVWASDEDGGHLDLSWGRDDTGRVTVPEQPFTVHIGAPGFRPARCGPLDPRDVGEAIEVRLERAAAVTGRVLADGVPVRGAEVHAHVVDRRQPRHYFAHELYSRLPRAAPQRARTDADGRFELHLATAGSYVVHAEAEGHARGTAPQIAYDPGIAPPALEIALGRTGTLEGRVLVAAGRSAEGQIVAATAGDGHVEVCVADAEGRFRFEGLAAGDWQVRPAQPDDQQWLRMARTWPEYEDEPVPFDVRLAPGATVAFDVDLRQRHAAEILGRLAVDGIDAGGWRVSVFCAGAWEIVPTLADGSFAHRTAPGDHTLHFSKDLPDGNRLRIGHTTTLIAGVNPVDVTVHTGALELAGLEPSAAANEDGPSEGYALVWTDTDCHYSFDPDANGAHRSPSLPVGRAQLRRRSEDQYRPEEGRVIAEVEIVAGQLRRVDVR